jgi:hypothetical protein
MTLLLYYVIYDFIIILFYLCGALFLIMTHLSLFLIITIIINTNYHKNETLKYGLV